MPSNDSKPLLQTVIPCCHDALTGGACDAQRRGHQTMQDTVSTGTEGQHATAHRLAVKIRRSSRAP